MHCVSQVVMLVCLTRASAQAPDLRQEHREALGRSGRIAPHGHLDGSWAGFPSSSIHSSVNSSGLQDTDLESVTLLMTPHLMFPDFWRNNRRVAAMAASMRELSSLQPKLGERDESAGLLHFASPPVELLISDILKITSVLALIAQVAPGLKLLAELAPSCPMEAAGALKWLASSGEWAAAAAATEAVEALRNQAAKEIRKHVFQACVKASAFGRKALPVIKAIKNADRARKQAALIQRWTNELATSSTSDAQLKLSVSTMPGASNVFSATLNCVLAGSAITFVLNRFRRKAATSGEEPLLADFA